MAHEVWAAKSGRSHFSCLGNYIQRNPLSVAMLMTLIWSFLCFCESPLLPPSEPGWVSSLCNKNKKYFKMKQFIRGLIARKSALEKTQLSDVLITDNLFC